MINHRLETYQKLSKLVEELTSVVGTYEFDCRCEARQTLMVDSVTKDAAVDAMKRLNEAQAVQAAINNLHLAVERLTE